MCCQCGACPEYEEDGTSVRWCATCLWKAVDISCRLFQEELDAERERKARERR